ncbi:uncharacterized protein N7483_007609 [Penicillium malachiteum]|uniref:uncharacterized protein n=1 Tax=Penicillium malachiteum TaxID=1324776 RepID=UPI002549C06B|nr:uncharacterized protein N7483_007609 [Penicillium malachiteum]KAJ5726252.1 hypothetical protein N7483_007609 [Penicillium malachiteum]
MTVGQSVIPLIDVSPFTIKGASEAEKEKVVAQVRDACRKYGFFQIVGHGIASELQAKVLECAKTFFDLSAEEKQKVGMEHAIGESNRGFEVIGGQKLQYDAFPDLKEGIYFGAEIDNDDPRAGTFLQGPNLWPEELPEKEFRMPIMEYHEKLLDLSQAILQILALGLPYPPDIFDEITKSAAGTVKLLHYPPQRSTDLQQLGAGAHTDFGSITLLLQQPDQTGLEVFYPPSKSWIPVPAVPGRYIVNIGDLLDGWTRGEYRSAVHRVINKTDHHRYSVPFFYDGNLSYKLRPLDGTSDEMAMTVEEHLRKKWSQSYSIKQ